jgi:uncharacterized protein (DUF1810 family)
MEGAYGGRLGIHRFIYLQNSGVAQALHARSFEQGVAHQKVAVAAHEIHGHTLRSLLEHVHALQGKRVLGVIAYPDFKQIAQDEEGVCGGVRHVLGPRLKGGGLAGVKV